MVPPGIEVAWIDWQKGSAGDTWSDGRSVHPTTGRVLSTDVRKALRAMYGAIILSSPRFARVRS